MKPWEYSDSLRRGKQGETTKHNTHGKMPERVRLRRSVTYRTLIPVGILPYLQRGWLPLKNDTIS